MPLSDRAEPLRLDPQRAAESYLAEAPPEEGQEAAPGAEFEFGEADLAKIGSALDPGKPAPQTSWSEHMINTVCDLGRRQGDFIERLTPSLAGEVWSFGVPSGGDFVPAGRAGPSYVSPGYA